VVSALFALSLAGHLLTTGGLTRAAAPADSYEAAEARIEPGEKVEVRVESEVVMTVEVEAEIPVLEEAAEEEAPAPAAEELAAPQEEEPAAEELDASEEAAEPTAAEQGVVDAGAVEEPALPAAPSDEVLREAESEGEVQDSHAPEIAQEEVAGAATPLSTTLAMEKAAAERDSPTAAPPPQPTVSGPTALPDSGGAESGVDDGPDPSPTVPAAPAPSVGEDDVASPVPEAEHVVATPSAEEPAPSVALLEAQRPVPSFPWRALQVGLGSSAVVLIAATIWAWRVRR
jgi:2-oxoglutarate dehydrogenase E2 component (dihydrolipoamide succinyltransferase)